MSDARAEYEKRVRYTSTSYVSDRYVEELELQNQEMLDILITNLKITPELGDRDNFELYKNNKIRTIKTIERITQKKIEEVLK